MRRTCVGHASDPAGGGLTRRKGGTVSLAALFALCAGAASAQSFTPPEACAAFLTVQARDCRVATYWRCPSDPAGTVWEGVHDQDGGYSLVQYDAEFQWLDMRFYDGWRDRLVAPAADPISTTHLLARGWDSYDFELRSETDTPVEGVTITRVAGIDVLTGETEEIDGETLLNTRFHIAYLDEDGKVDTVSSGAQFFSPAHRIFFFGTEVLSDGSGTSRFDSSPMTFTYPGEPGFADTRPAFGCTGTPDADGKKAAGGKG